MEISHKRWGVNSSGEAIELFRLTNSSGFFVELTNLGATWVSAVMSSGDGSTNNMLLGYESAEGYMNDSYYMGSTVGRFANRIHNASFNIDGVGYQLDKNEGSNSNHGGLSGFHKKVWKWEKLSSGICFSLFSPDGEGGYPGNVNISVEYLLNENNEFLIHYWGKTDRPTYLNMTNHAYFNLSGDKRKITDHCLQVFSDTILETTSEYIPTGTFTKVAGSPFDFTQTKRIGDSLYSGNEQLRQNRGFNHCYVLKKSSSEEMRQAARLSDPGTNRELIIETDLPGILLYTAGYLPCPDTGVCLETQFFPDTPSHANFPSCLLLPEEEYCHRTLFKFNFKTL